MPMQSCCATLLPHELRAGPGSVTDSTPLCDAATSSSQVPLHLPLPWPLLLLPLPAPPLLLLNLRWLVRGGWAATALLLVCGRWRRGSLRRRDEALRLRTLVQALDQQMQVGTRIVCGPVLLLIRLYLGSVLHRCCRCCSSNLGVTHGCSQASGVYAQPSLALSDMGRGE